HSPFTPVTTHDPQLGAKTNAPPMTKGKTENRSSVFPLGIGGSLVIPTEGGSVAAVGLDHLADGVAGDLAGDDHVLVLGGGPDRGQHVGERLGPRVGGAR